MNLFILLCDMISKKVNICIFDVSALRVARDKCQGTFVPRVFVRSTCHEDGFTLNNS